MDRLSPAGLAETAAAFRGTWLSELSLSPGDRGTLIVDAIPEADLLDAWETAYDRVPMTGRQPVVVSEHLHHPAPRWTVDPAAPSPVELAALDEAARTLDPWAS
jgi:hypothetical protein